MSEISESVWNTAREIVGEPYGDLTEGMLNIMALYVSQAILMEREECAKVAEQRFTLDSVLKTSKREPYLTGKAAIHAAKVIASSIRRRT